MREAVVLDSFPSPAVSHSDSMSRIDSPRTNAPITIARSGSVRRTFVLHGKQLGDERLGGPGNFRHWGDAPDGGAETLPHGANRPRGGGRASPNDQWSVHRWGPRVGALALASSLLGRHVKDFSAPRFRRSAHRAPAVGAR